MIMVLYLYCRLMGYFGDHPAGSMEDAGCCVFMYFGAGTLVETADLPMTGQ